MKNANFSHYPFILVAFHLNKTHQTAYDWTTLTPRSDPSHRLRLNLAKEKVKTWSFLENFLFVLYVAPFYPPYISSFCSRYHKKYIKPFTWTVLFAQQKLLFTDDLLTFWALFFPSQTTHWQSIRIDGKNLNAMPQCAQSQLDWYKLSVCLCVIHSLDRRLLKASKKLKYLLDNQILNHFNELFKNTTFSISISLPFGVCPGQQTQKNWKS